MLCYSHPEAGTARRDYSDILQRAVVLKRMNETAGWAAKCQCNGNQQPLVPHVTSEYIYELLPVRNAPKEPPTRPACEAGIRPGRFRMQL